MAQASVSVIMPVYNPKPHELYRALTSVLNQSFTDFELVICDDCSDGYVRGIIEEFSDKYENGKIIYIRNEKNSGCAASLNRCIEKSSGQLLIRQDADDYSLQGRFEKIVKEYEENNADIV
ncbi:MAG: glycosyltransferase, partial [Ruminiclostridium sp.]|nr:glycosyltransferase [Ruminiclostridium sp.]